MPLYKMMYRKPRIQKSGTMRVRCMHFYTAKVLMYIDVCQTYSTKKYTCVYTAVTHDEIDAALAAIILKPSTPSITPSKGGCLA